MNVKHLSAQEAAALLERARALKTPEKTWGHVARVLKVSDDWLRRRVDPEYGERRRQQINANRRGERKHTRIADSAFSRVKEDELEARRAEIPEDRRDLTGRLLGDPLPGRSALDRRAGA